MLGKENRGALAGALPAGIREPTQGSFTRTHTEAQARVTVIRKNALEEIRVGLSEFNGHDLLDLRVWAEPRNGGSERIPTKAGIACNVRLLPQLIEALQKAEAAARTGGLL